MSLLLLLRGAVAAGVRTLTLVSSPAVPARGDLVTITATLLDENGDPLVAKSIYFEVTGANSGSGSDTTDVNGEATFQYTATNAGTDGVLAQWGLSTGLNLISMDTSTDQIYEHDGFSTTILDQFTTPGGTPRNVGLLGENVISSDGQMVYLHDGFSTTILDSFDAGAAVLGIASDGTNVFVATSATVTKHAGFSATVLQTVSLPGVSISGIGWDGENLLVGVSVNLADDEVRRYVGFSATLDQTVTLPYSHSLMGLAWDGFNLVTAADDTGGSGPDKLYLHDGFSASIDTQIASPNSQIRSVAWGVGLAASLELDIAVIGRGLMGAVSGRLVP